MKLSVYKKGLISEDPEKFCEALMQLSEDLYSEKNIYNGIKKVKSFLVDEIESVDKSEIIENDVYRIIPKKYSMLYALAIALQTEIEVAEKEIAEHKYLRTYTWAKQTGINPEKKVEKIVLENIIPYILQVFTGFTNKKMYGYKDIHEIDETIKKSKLVHSMSRIGLLIKRELLSKDKSLEKEMYDFEGHFSELADKKREGMEIYLGENLLKSKITILHIPLFHEEYPSIYLDKINTVLVAEYMKDGIKENRLFAEFGMYVQYKITGNIMKIPNGFNLKNPNIHTMGKANLFFDLFAYKVMEGTVLEEMHNLKKNLEPFPSAMKEFLEDASYFDILVEENK